MRSIFATKWLLLCVLLLCEQSFGQGKTDFLVNDDGSRISQDHPRIAVAGDGSFAIVWVDRRTGTSDIFLQRYSATFDRLGTNQRVNSNVSAYQFEPAMASDRSGSLSIVWKDYRNGTYPFSPDIYFQSYDSVGTGSGANRELTTELPDTLKETPDISLAAWGKGVVVWADFRNNNWDIYGQLIAPDGTLLGSNFLVNDDGGSAQQHAPRVSISPAGWFVVTWYDNRWGNDDIFVQLYDSSGTKIGINVKANELNSTRQAFPDVATDGSGNFTVVWVDWRNGTYPANPDIYSRKFDTSLVPLTASKKVNRDGSFRAQREPSIAADYLGNVAIIWSDSNASSWDIMGQMIDVNGVVREANFQANSFVDSMQLQADVALDGVSRFVTWADRRNGHLDIYASITRYNDPHLKVNPSSVVMTMEKGSPLPAPTSVSVDHAGYSPLDFTVSSGASWLVASPASGTTPATVQLSIDTSGLAAGTYLTDVTFVDTLNHDSSTFLTLRLDILNSSLSLSDDTLTFTGSAINVGPFTKKFQVTNAGVGTMSWTAIETATWLAIAPLTGMQNDSVTVTVSAVALNPGTYVEPIVVTAASASTSANSPDTVWVSLVVDSVISSLMVIPDSIYVKTDKPANLNAYTVLTGSGDVPINWVVTTSSPWLIISPVQGVANDSVVITAADSMLHVGLNTAYAIFTDTTFGLAVDTLTVQIDLLEQFISQPDSLVFGMFAGDPDPPPQSLTISHYGYTNISYRVSNNRTWLSVSSSTGLTPDSLSVSVSGAGLADGLYVGYVTLSDNAGVAPDLNIVIRLLVSGPVIGLSTDTLTFSGFSMTDETLSQPLSVTNTGFGQLNWKANSGVSWLTATPQSGTAPGSLMVNVNAATLSGGGHLEPLVFTADDVSVLPETLWVSFLVSSQVPQFDLRPQQFTIRTATPNLIDTFAIVSNSGLGTLNWQANWSESWLSISPSVGSAGDTLRLRVSGLPNVPGRHRSTISFKTNALSKVTYQLPLIIDYYEMSSDTVFVGSTNTPGNQPGSFFIAMRLNREITDLVLPLRYDNAVLAVDSIKFDPNLPSTFNSSFTIDNASGTFIIRSGNSAVGEVLPPGFVALATVHFTPAGPALNATIDTALIDSIAPLVINLAGRNLTPHVVSGKVAVTVGTSVEQGNPNLPKRIRLSQNYPNPFNPTTLIEFYLPRTLEIHLGIYNVLGQEVAVLANGRLQAGSHRRDWDGNATGGKSAPSGIYFLRLRSGTSSQVRKMVLSR